MANVEKGKEGSREGEWMRIESVGESWGSRGGRDRRERRTGRSDGEGQCGVKLSVAVVRAEGRWRWRVAASGGKGGEVAGSDGAVTGATGSDGK